MLSASLRKSLILVFAALTFSSGFLQAATLQCSHLPLLFEFYLKQHYAIHALTDAVKAHTVDQYIKDLDPSKTMLLEADVTKLKKDLVATFGTMGAGNCAALDQSAKLMIERAKENEDYVRKYLGPDYKLDETIEFVLDPKKRVFSKSIEDRQDIMRKMVHFQISSYLLSDMKLPEAKKHLVHRYELVTKRLKERKSEDIMASFAEGFALALDPHSSFLSKDNLEDFRIQMQLSLEGIGASLSPQDGFTVIEELIPGGGAEKSKALRPKDKIIAVAQDKGKPVSVIDMDLRDVVKLIRGKKGTKVRLTILRQAETTKTFEVTIVRDKIDIKDQAAKIAYETRKVGDKTLKIGIIELPSFYGGGGRGTRSSSADVKELLAQATHEKVDGLVLNLSRNGGGLLEEAVKISGLFLKKGNVVATKDTDTKVQTLADEDDDTEYSGPLVVVISRLSASASEILAGALKDYKRALIIGGDHTFGKGTVQVISGLPLDLGGIKVTTGMFFLPGGASTQHSGVTSDVRMPSVFNIDDIGENTLDYSLPPQAIPAFLSKDANGSEPGKHWQPVEDGLVKKLADKSKDRVAKEPKWTEVKKNIEEINKNAGIVKLAEIRKKSQEELKAGKKKDKSHREGLKDKEKAEDDPSIQEGVNIAADMATLH